MSHKIDYLVNRYNALREVDASSHLLSRAVVGEGKSRVLFTPAFFDVYQCDSRNSEDRARAIFQYAQDLDMEIWLSLTELAVHSISVR
ncbi:MAG: hypothetical protein UR98_C0005G0004 [Parcubacteria group bacterium GW2011_GWA1_36_12]|nr:MAG: hypothetical protein UR98_C0005G0004 [Parcubacteria group bacterium GW2011_GWA1_36_12]